MQKILHFLTLLSLKDVERDIGAARFGLANGIGSDADILEKSLLLRGRKCGSLHYNLNSLGAKPSQRGHDGSKTLMRKQEVSFVNDKARQATRTLKLGEK